jgi:hypothetical protein
MRSKEIVTANEECSLKRLVLKGRIKGINTRETYSLKSALNNF